MLSGSLVVRAMGLKRNSVCTRRDGRTVFVPDTTFITVAIDSHGTWTYYSMML